MKRIRFRFISPRPTLIVRALIFVLSAVTSLRAQTFSAFIPTTDYGYLDQHNLNYLNGNGFIGNEACVPTSSTNALTFLQNQNPGLFGTALTGTGYNSWINTDQQLIGFYGTVTGSGTESVRIPYGIPDYLASLPGNYSSDIALSGEFRSGVPWSTLYPEPSYITTANPTPQFIYNALVNNEAVLLSLSYKHADGSDDTGGHELLVNGISWDSLTDAGTISFIDPLNPSPSNTILSLDGTTYQGTSAMSTTGTITLGGPDDSNPGFLFLSYQQYHGQDDAPYDQSTGTFQTAYATIDDVLTLSVIPEPSQYGFFVLLSVVGFLGWDRLSKRPRGRSHKF